MSFQATSLTDFSFYFMTATAVKGLSEVAQADVRKLVETLVPRLQIVHPVRQPVAFEDITEFYLLQHAMSERVHGIACFRVEPAKTPDDKSVIIFYGVSLLSGGCAEGSDLDTASEFGLRERLEQSSRDYLAECVLAKVVNLSTLKL